MGLAGQQGAPNSASVTFGPRVPVAAGPVWNSRKTSHDEQEVQP